jgi:PAS domain S-box-containing protein
MPTDSLELSASPSVAATRQALNRRIAQLFFAVGVGISLTGTVVYGSLPLPVLPGLQRPLTFACLALAALFGLGMLLLQRYRVRHVVLAICGCGLVVTAFTGIASGEGVHSQTLGFLGLLVCLLTLLTRMRAGLVAALASAAFVLALAIAQDWNGSLPELQALIHSAELMNVLTLFVMLVTAVASGGFMSRIVNRALLEAEEREQRFVSLLRIAADWYWELDENLRFSHVSSELNPAAAGLSSRWRGMHPWGISELQLTPDVAARQRERLEAHQPFSDLPMRRQTEAGKMHFFSVSGRPRFDADGRFLGYWGVGRDVTEEVRARQAVSASESRYRELFARSPSPIILHRGGQVLDANDAAAQLFGFTSAAAMIGYDIAQLNPAGPERERERARIARLESLPPGSALEVADFEMLALDGSRLSVQATGVRVNTSDGPASLSIYFDITARMAAEESMRRSQAMLSHLFATSPDFITMSEMGTGRYVMVNKSFSRIFGYEADEVIGKSALDLGIWYRAEDRQKMVEQLTTHGGVYDLPAWFVNKSGAPVSLMMSAARFQMDGRDYLVVNGRDVTDVQRARLEYETILQSVSIGISLVRDQRFLRANPRFEAIFGWPGGELIGQPGGVVWPDEADFARALDEFDPTLAEGKPVEMEREMRRRDGSRFWCRLIAQVVDPTHPRLGGTIWIAEDVTERRRVEQALAAARDAAEAASRAKSAFLANTSHEIRTPLNGLMGLARLAVQPDVDPTRRTQYLEQIHDSARSLADIISDILDLSKIEAGKFSIESVPFDLRKLLGAVHHAYQSLAQGRSIALELRVADDVPTVVRGDPVRVRQILSNYITNGLKFTERGEVRIEVSSASPGVVRFEVIDTGPGIEPAVQQRLFQPFTQADESTTRRYGGTGLGLSICKELSELMHGECGVDSRLGAGSRFWVELPLPETDALNIDAEADAEDAARLQGVDVLLVEDNPVNMMIGVAMLEQWGARVEQAADGHEAVEAVLRAAEAGHPFDAVLMDVQMPRLSGHEAAARLRERFDARSLPIIALTAAALVSEREQALASGMNDFLTKPIDPQKLRRALARVLRAGD